MGKGKNEILCHTEAIAWFLWPFNLILMMIVNIWNAILGIIPPLKKAINTLLYYIIALLIRLFSMVGLNFIAKTIRWIAESFIRAGTPYGKQIKLCKKTGKHYKKIKTQSVVDKIMGMMGSVSLPQDEEDDEHTPVTPDESTEEDTSSQPKTVFKSSDKIDINPSDYSTLYIFLAMSFAFGVIYLTA